MQKVRLVLTFVVALVVAAALGTASGYGCTMLIVGKSATSDGSVLIARNEDFPGNWAKHIIVVPKADHKPGETIESATGFSMPLPPVTYGYISLQDWDPSQGRFNEGGINEYQVGVSATESAKQNEKAKLADPLVDTGVGENIVTALVLQQAKTAAEGVELVGHLVEEYGASETFGMAIGDPDEAWLLEVGGGHHWVAVRVPDDSYVLEPNELRIGEVNLEDTANFKGAPTSSRSRRSTGYTTRRVVNRSTSPRHMGPLLIRPSGITAGCGGRSTSSPHRAILIQRLSGIRCS